MASPTHGCEFEQAPGDGDGQGGLVCCSPWGGKELDTTGRLKNSNSKSVGARFPTLVLSLAPESLFLSMCCFLFPLLLKGMVD